VIKMVISTENLSKTYGQTKAVQKVSLTVNKGEIYGFLGLNGAGKTTTIRMLLGMIKPTSGLAKISGETVSAGSYQIWRDVGYMVETPYSYPELTVFDNLEIVRQLRGIKDKSATDKIIHKLSLQTHANKKAKNLSLGNAQRLGLAKALIHEPKILLLDEPTNGLDPEGIVEVRNLLRSMAHEKGITIFISSHLLGEISLIADRIGIIHEGKLISEMNAGEFEHLRHKDLIINTTDNQKAKKTLVQNEYAVSEYNQFLRCDSKKAVENPESISVMLVNAGCPPKSIQVESEDLETYFLRVIHAEGVKS